MIVCRQFHQPELVRRLIERGRRLRLVDEMRHRFDHRARLVQVVDLIVRVVKS